MLVTIIIGLSHSANAGILDWAKSEDNKIIPDEIVGSFDKLYQDIKDPTLAISNTADVADGFVSAANNLTATKNETRVLTKAYKVSVSAYSSTVDQTDSSPFITAAGTFVHDGIVAANFLPIGTAIKIPAVFGDKIFVVEDRMNSRYWHNVDIWFPDRESAINFGRKNLQIEVLL